MSIPNPASGEVDLSDAPTGDLTLDALFPPEPSDTPTTATPAAPADPAAMTPAPATQAPAQTVDEPFIKSGNIVYKTREAAIEGISKKDALIEQMRTRYVLATGIDPITGQPVGTSSATPNRNYTQDSDAYVKDFYSALNSGKSSNVRDVQAKFVMDMLEPFAPLLQQTARESALKQFESEVPSGRQFIGSAEYNEALAAEPDLKDAIALSESDPKFASRLPGYYRLAYRVSQGIRLPEIIKAQTAPKPNTPAPVRTSTPATTPALTEPATAPNLSTKEGRKAIIEQFESSQLANQEY